MAGVGHCRKMDGLSAEYSRKRFTAVIIEALNLTKKLLIIIIIKKKNNTTTTCRKLILIRR